MNDEMGGAAAHITLDAVFIAYIYGRARTVKRRFSQFIYYFNIHINFIYLLEVLLMKEKLFIISRKCCLFCEHFNSGIIFVCR